ncbi:MAG: hypothetical protein EZS28_004137 [Streblomastix strix]|uniref:DDE-1 domain-containing protein n=1 Tax=Streblomastix strix TaxID=222440 RepID=A0A5J4X146_9EUKA|nr:MAG: hypothetical protein EZS28_004137 [Streblomastix strix]
MLQDIKLNHRQSIKELIFLNNLTRWIHEAQQQTQTIQGIKPKKYSKTLTNVVFPAIINCRQSIVDATQKKEKEKLDQKENRSPLIIDGHTSRTQPDLCRIAYGQGLDVTTIPAYSSTVVQRLDCGINASFKQKLAKFMSLTEDRRDLDINQKAPSAAVAYLTRFADSLDEAFTIAKMPGSVRAAWATFGLDPFNESVFDDLPDEIEDIGNCVKKVENRQFIYS